MKIYRGSEMLLKIQINDKFEIVGGMRVTRLNLSNQLIDASNKDSGSWRLLIENSGLKSLSLIASGVLTNSDAERHLARAAFESTLKKYQLISESGDCIEGSFYVLSYERSGNVFEEEAYSIALESSGDIEFFYMPRA
jgi:TP901-1 family phage major tail protein